MKAKGTSAVLVGGLGLGLGLAFGIRHRTALRLWALRTLAHGGPVMMNITLEDGTVKLKGCADFGYFYRVNFIRTPSAEEAVAAPLVSVGTKLWAPAP